jgi:hypothetical protein
MRKKIAVRIGNE